MTAGPSPSPCTQGEAVPEMAVLSGYFQMGHRPRAAGAGGGGGGGGAAAEPEGSRLGRALAARR